MWPRARPCARRRSRCPAPSTAVSSTTPPAPGWAPSALRATAKPSPRTSVSTPRNMPGWADRVQPPQP
ncbi:hypothetical protein M911_11165 [Ectothiorhodospira haloalkaliphila]|uniref:Uncharacterized protein n=1 Tax=Ectothiorhodospira haloalkaliphila TaxID=421628 RepID=W8KKH9_9GAMM|nr:hypothetical protein M911_11165 [Ectothiorhodospira haloalkaliphila]